MFPCCIICYEECGCVCATEGRQCTRAFFGKSNSTCLNLLFAPLALTIHAIYTYVFGCLWVYLTRGFRFSCCFMCVHYGWFKNVYMYEDRNFGRNDRSLGTSEEEGVEWKRASEMMENPILFENDANPLDIVQGNVGNCWLMSALACMAEFPGLVDSVFITREFSTRGKYAVTLYDGFQRKWRVITVDDYLPTQNKDGNNAFKKNEYMYAQPQGRELWVAILEKAFAKFRGSYEALNGGNPLYAFRCLTGDNVYRLMKEPEDSETPNEWRRCDLVDKAPEDTTPFKVTETDKVYKTHQLFNLLRHYDRERALMAASVRVSDESLQKIGSEELDETTGLVRGHAYAVLALKRVGKGLLGEFSEDKEFDMVQLRNPWGEFEWKGDWSDTSDMWDRYPKVKKALRPVVNESDGLFWMDFNDFVKHFDNIDVCDRNVSYKDFHLDVHEGTRGTVGHCMGPTIGCFSGCLRFWLLCEGVRFLYCSRKSNKDPDEIEDLGRDDGLLGNIV